ncbi:MAG: bifunctional serine/threonine-protein kinase/formylglycine-generating enzyme family protein [Planctomycetota bacterium]
MTSAVDPDELLEALRLDQEYRWRSHSPWLAEDYQRCLQPLPSTIPWRLELAAGEWLCRSSAGALVQADLQSRFPDLQGLWGHLFERLDPVDSESLVNGVVQRFRELQAGGEQMPRIEFSLAGLPVALRAGAFERLLEVELSVVRSRGVAIDAEAWLHRFPRYTSQIEQFLSGLGEAGEKDQTLATEADTNFSRTQPVRLPAEEHQTAVVLLTGTEPEEDIIPAMIAGYRIERQLGRGGCGRVLLGTDPETGARVALKQIRRREVNDRSVQLLLREAGTATNLTQTLQLPGIVRMHRVVEHDGMPVLVMDYVDGEDLSKRLRVSDRHARLRWQPQAPDVAVSIIRELAEILQRTHEQGYYHRDLKPANVLVDRSGKLWLTDFGIALHESEWNRDPTAGGGTLAYMAPEQLQGESNRVDGRVDIWSLGVILYQLLSGRLPWYGGQAELIDQINRRGHTPLRQRDRSIPERLSLICDKCLRVNREARYLSVASLLDDLTHWQLPGIDGGSGDLWMLSGSGQQSGSSAWQTDCDAVKTGFVSGSTNLPQVRIRPRGLSSYDEGDRHFFIRMLPGDLEPDGIPESLHYWLGRLQARTLVADSETFAVGVIHGSSGCGKSSFIKAGLLPLLTADIVPVFVEASAGTTEMLLRRRLRGLFGEIPAELPLPEIFRRLHEGEWLSPGQRLLIVLDQFEQWLDQHSGQQGTLLAKSLRHCSPGRIQTILLVREEFWTATSEFMKDQLNLDLSTRSNDQMLPLFSTPHAAMVLAAFGAWYGRLPQNPHEQTKDQAAFVTQAVQGLAQRGRVIPVQLAVFAQMFRDLEWTTVELARQGGAAGAGVRFLEQQFSSADTVERQRRHFNAVCRILEELLPSSGSQIRGRMQSRRRLLDVSGYAQQPAKFEELMQILEQDLRILTRTDAAELSAAAKEDSFYLLTHDFLVPSVRSWLETELQKTGAGRALATLRLRERIYSERHESRQLPSLAEWLQIRLHTDRRRWTEAQQAMMRKAGWRHFRLFAVSCMLGLLIAAGVFRMFQQLRKDEMSKQLETAVAALVRSNGASIPGNLAAFQGQSREDVRRRLWQEFQKSRQFEQRLALVYALAEYDQLHIDFLLTHFDNFDQGDSSETANLIAALRNSPAAEKQRLRDAAALCTAPETQRRKARLAITLCALGDFSVAEDVCETAGRDDHGTRTYFIDELSRWRVPVGDLLGAVRASGSPSFHSAICLGIGSRSDQSLTPEDRTNAVILAESFLEAGDSSRHSAAVWLLRKLQIPVVSRASWHGIQEGRDWFLHHRNSLMVRIEPPQGQQMFWARGAWIHRPSHEYWIASREVSRGDFDAYIADSDYHSADPEVVRRFLDESTTNLSISRQYGATPEHPMQNVTWHDAVRYCNWLSIRDSLRPVYLNRGLQMVRDRNNRLVERLHWEVDPLGTGYRLPTTEEWLNACRAGSQTAWTCGNDQNLLAAYCRMQPSELTLICGTRLPNAWGLHDVHGNVQEWCHSADNTGDFRRICGGSVRSPATECRSDQLSQDAPEACTVFTGFRIARGPLRDQSAGWVRDTVPEGSSDEQTELNPGVPVP